MDTRNPDFRASTRALVQAYTAMPLDTRHARKALRRFPGGLRSQDIAEWLSGAKPGSLVVALFADRGRIDTPLVRQHLAGITGFIEITTKHTLSLIHI